MIPYFSLDSSAQIEQVRQQMLARHQARTAQLLAGEERERQHRLELIKALTPLITAAYTQKRKR